MDVGFIGLGNMGAAMACSLLKAGHKVTVYNRTRSKAEALAGEGARVAASIADACRGEVVLSMLADDHAVEGVVCGEGGILHSLAEERIHISMSTISVALSERLARLHKEKHQTYATATVFGRPEAAAAGKLFVVAAGPVKAIEKCQTLFDAMGQKTFVVGEKADDANLVKLSGNFLIAATIESLGEAVALVRKSGIDAHRFVEILTGTLFSAPVYNTYGAIIASETYDPAGFKMALGLKDIKLALAAAETLNVPLPIASLVRDHFLSGLAQGQGDSDWAALARIAAKNSGL
ncbi:NAD(P)-dependent oxidoreductase [Methylocapsa sp. D3K7]|uniref:NAD(P)-dependent oxidoreductase n=1 Tax=Methylocapsa sp. D3K7 TaxID=3041435 RepID=UPI00244E6C27|nr:NAD(P)-dependent oxidoreductase [Methylocapsa sp. D3K7]WGJ14771.1 NAD(P)-dependent oxidoreductase [Methylocapsa sp. D3K7]